LCWNDENSFFPFPIESWKAFMPFMQLVIVFTIACLFVLIWLGYGLTEFAYSV
jgi:hypothetical protein